MAYVPYAVGMFLMGYALGNLMFALIIGKMFYGVDVRTAGSGNLGATNAWRVLGPAAGIGVFAGDFSKGVLAVLLAGAAGSSAPEATRHLYVVLAGFGAMAGHTWPVYLGLKGGKGVAVAAGVLLAVFNPLMVVILAVEWAAAVAITRYVSISSVAIAVTFPVLTVFFHQGNYPYVAFSIAASAVVIFNHRTNLARLLAGTESKVGQPPESKRGYNA